MEFLDATVMFFLEMHIQLNYENISHKNNVYMQTINMYVNLTNEAIIVQC